MRLKLRTLAAFLTVGCLSQAALSAEKPEELVTRSRALYPTLHSYSDTGEVIDEFGPKPADVHRHKFKTYFRAPRQFYFEASYPRGSNTASLAFQQSAAQTKRAATVWIDAETRLLRKIIEDTPKGMPASAVMRITTVLEPHANPELDDSVFRYRSPHESPQ